MVIEPKKRNIAYRCPECGTAIIGLVGKFTLSADLIRLRCSCEDAASLDINATNDKKIRLSVPCIFCKQNHGYTVSDGVFFNRDKFLLNCPYSGMDIAFIGDDEDIERELKRTEEEIGKLMVSLEAEELSDIQPEEMSEDEILPEPAVYDTLKFLLKDLEEEGHVICPCGKGGYDLRFTDDGIQAFCESCGATYTFRSVTPGAVEEYLYLDEIRLN